MLLLGVKSLNLTKYGLSPNIFVHKIPFINVCNSYDSFSDKVLDRVTKRAKIEKSFKHIFSGDFAFECIRGKPV